MSTPTWYPAAWHFGFTVDDDDQPVRLTGPDDPDALTYAYCEEAERAAIDAKQIVRGKVNREKCKTSDLADELEIVVSNRKAIRNCWRTPDYVWETVCKIAGLTPGVSEITDPFFHPDAWTAPYATVKLDGHEGSDGFDTSLWRGFALVNGPHSDSSRVAEAAHEYGERAFAAPGNGGAAIFVPYRGDRWFRAHVAPAPIWLHFGRTACVAPVSVKQSGPPGCTIVGVWASEGASVWTKRLYNGGNYRLTVTPNERSKVEVLVTRGVPAQTYNLND